MELLAGLVFVIAVFVVLAAYFARSSYNANLRVASARSKEVPIVTLIKSKASIRTLVDVLDSGFARWKRESTDNEDSTAPLDTFQETMSFVSFQRTLHALVSYIDDDGRCLAALCQFLDKHMEDHRALIYLQDPAGRSTLDLSSKAMKEAMIRRLLFCGRYQVKSSGVDTCESKAN